MDKYVTGLCILYQKKMCIDPLLSKII
jgi:hypothetical protein